MNSKEVVIDPPITVTRVYTLNKMVIRITELTLFESVSIMVSLYSDNNTIYDNKYFKLEGTDYQNWNNDDNYIVQYVSQRISSETP